MTRPILPAVAALALLLSAVVPAAAAPPEVVKVDPPSWWPGHSIDPVRLLVRGRNLSGAQVTGVGPGLTTGPVAVNAAGTYLFVDVAIARQAEPGPRTIAIRTAGGSAKVPFDVLAPLPRPGRFQGFSEDDAIYLLMPDRFADGDASNDDPPRSKGLLDRAKARFYHGGDLRGVIDRLPYLKDLGVTAIWLNPWYDNVDHLNERETYDGQAITDYHGYGAVDFYAVDEHLGDLATLREMVDRAHSLGLKVIQDQVANHSGPYHPWAKDAPTPAWYYGTQERHLANTWQTWTLHDPYATPDMQKSTLEGWFIDILPDLNQDDPEVARYTIQNTLWWAGVSGLDGIRQDTLPYVHRRFWKDWMAAIKKEYPDLRVVGELFDGDPVLVSFYQGGVARFDGLDSGVDTLFDFPLFFRIRDAFAKGGSLREVAMMLARDHLYRDASPLVTFLGLHDVPRFMNEPGATLEGLKSAFTFLATARGTPLVYYGDEIAMPGGGDPDNRRDFPGGWKGDPRNAFEGAGRSAGEESVHARVRALLTLRQATPALRRGRTVNLQVADRTWVYARVLEGRAAIVALNTGGDPASLDVPAGPVGLADGALLSDRLATGATAVVAGGRLRIALPARESAILMAP
ncbi:MAG TPA: alpha-amylase family glycosyl hydrolase [Vicinamibacteria bacterium]|nr:alpha-amylase family glycosyl hydrolase [Vicinamibacteria bacterium]